MWLLQEGEAQRNLQRHHLQGGRLAFHQGVNVLRKHICVTEMQHRKEFATLETCWSRTAAGLMHCLLNCICAVRPMLGLLLSVRAYCNLT